MILLLSFRYDYLLRIFLQGCKTVLDLGTADGDRMRSINHDHAFEVTGVELFTPYIKAALKTGVYKKIHCQDITHFDYKKNSFDAVFASQVLEHFDKKTGYSLLEKWEQTARKKVIVAVPQGEFPQEAYDGNVLQQHHSSWDVDDFKSRGYRVYGQGWKHIYGNKRMLHLFARSKFLGWLLTFIGYAVSPLVFLLPHQGTFLIAVKSKEN